MIRAALRSIAILAALSMCGCDLTEETISPFSDKPVTAAELKSEAEQFAAKAELTDQKEQAETERRIRLARRQAELQARKLTNATGAQLADIEASLEAEIDDAVAAFDTGQAEREQMFAAMRERVAAASDDLTRKREQRLALWNGIKSVTGAIPGLQAVPGVQQGFGLVETLLFGGAAAGVVQLSKRGLRRKLDDTEAAAERVVDSIDWLKDVSPDVAQAFATHSDKLKEWQGDGGKALVKRLQIGRGKA